jgi:membrane-bound lytic murein transglycosylase B
MGQPQFAVELPQAAEDFDGDGRRDIWAAPADIFASIANYLKSSGWVATQTWGREVKVTKDAAARIKENVSQRTSGCDASRQMTERLPLQRWEELGVRLPGNKPLPKADMDASLLKAARGASSSTATTTPSSPTTAPTLRAARHCPPDEPGSNPAGAMFERRSARRQAGAVTGRVA